MVNPVEGLIRIVILSPYPLIRPGLRLQLETQAGMQVVGEAEATPEGFTLVACQKPEVVLLEVVPGSPPGLEAISELIKAWQQSRIILILGAYDARVYMQAVREGVLGVVLKTQPPEVLIKAIRKVRAGEIWIERAMVADLLTSLSHNRLGFAIDPETECISKLSRRERQVIQLIGKGLKNQQIGAQLCISEATVRRHLTSVYTKLGVSDRLELLVYANRNGLV